MSYPDSAVETKEAQNQNLSGSFRIKREELNPIPALELTTPTDQVLKEPVLSSTVLTKPTDTQETGGSESLEAAPLPAQTENQTSPPVQPIFGDKPHEKVEERKFKLESKKAA